MSPQDATTGVVLFAHGSSVREANDGVRELARQVRKRVGRKDVLLIAVTGYGFAHDIHLSKDAGFDHVLVKPVVPDVIRGLLAAKQARHHTDSAHAPDSLPVTLELTTDR